MSRTAVTNRRYIFNMDRRLQDAATATVSTGLRRLQTAATTWGNDYLPLLRCG
ncbi:MAG: hypothetical protein AAGF95_08000 [Chloroflexota bacterium]